MTINTKHCEKFSRTTNYCKLIGTIEYIHVPLGK